MGGSPIRRLQLAPPPRPPYWRDHYRIVGLPMPMVFFHLEDGQWVDFIVPFPWVNLTCNIITFGLAGAVAMATVLGRGDSPPRKTKERPPPRAACGGTCR
jgi:hypothetical protein